MQSELWDGKNDRIEGMASRVGGPNWPDRFWPVRVSTSRHGVMGMKLRGPVRGPAIMPQLSPNNAASVVLVSMDSNPACTTAILACQVCI